MNRFWVTLAFLIFPLLIIAQPITLQLLSEQLQVEEELTSIADSLDNVLLKFYGGSGIDISKINDKQLYLKAIDWLGVKYIYGHSAKNGVDCSGFVKSIATGLLVDKLQGGSNEIYHQCKPIDKGLLAEGDLVFFKINKPHISHVGIYLQNNKFIHATVKEGVIISDLSEKYYQRYYFDSCRLE